jgi:OOP family OmpA-OmpF porin
MMKRLVPSMSAVGAVLLLAGLARAQSAADGEFSVQRFAPAPGPRNFVTVEGARTDGKMAWSAGLFANYAYDPFVVKSCVSQSDCSAANAVQKDDVPVVESLATADLLASLTPMPKLQLGMRLPVTYVKGQGINTDLSDPNAGRPLSGGVSGAGLGDLYLEAKLRAYGAVNSPFVLGAALFGTAPLGHATAKDKYLGDSSPTFGLRGIFDGNAGPFSFGANLAGLYRGNETLGSTELGPEMRYGLAAGFRVSPVFRIIAEGFGATKLSSANGTNSLETDLSGQITPLNSSIAITIGGGTGIIEGVGVPKFRGFVGVLYNHEIVDTDGDGIPDNKDQCPTAPEDFDKFQDEDGCPDPDNDGDDIPDTADACPNTPGEKDPDPKKNGCPVVIADKDSDGIPDAEDKCPDDGGPNVIRRKGDYYGCPDTDKDGIPDKIDKCPNEPEDTDGYQDEDGCPDPDNDGDKILDQDDQCVDQPEVYNGFQDEDGCPDEVPDRDHDGIPDNKDKCPDKPENYNGYEDDDGCPDKGPSLVQVTGTEIKILDSVNFATDSDKIVGKRSFEVLDGVAAVMSHHPEIFKVEVQGHTDNAGNHDHNVDLSKRRAAAVVAYLTSKGIAADRLSAQGYGPDKPIADNKSAKGRSKNRRVEFQILQQSGKQGAAPTAAPAPAK